MSLVAVRILAGGRRTMQAMRTSPLVPKIPDFGINVCGFDLNHDNVSVEDREKIIGLVNRYRLVVFRNQGVMSGDCT